MYKKWNIMFDFIIKIIPINNYDYNQTKQKKGNHCSEISLLPDDAGWWSKSWEVPIMTEESIKVG